MRRTVDPLSTDDGGRNGILFVLSSCFVVGLASLKRSTLFQSTDKDSSDDCDQGYRDGNSDDYDEMLSTQCRVVSSSKKDMFGTVARTSWFIGASWPVESRRACADEAVDAISTPSTILARSWRTFVHIDGTVLSSEAGLADAFVVVHMLGTSATVGAGFGNAVVDLVLAKLSNVTWNALALEGVDAVDARRAVEARTVSAVVDVRLATIASVPT